MTSLSGVAGGFSAARAMPDMSAMRQRMFAKADADGSGGVDATELQPMLQRIAEHSGQDVGSATELLTKWDGDGDGSLNVDELDAGMKSLMPTPSSTVEFAQMRGGPAMGGMPPPPPDGGCGPDDGTGSAQATSSTSSTSSTDAADTNGDGVVSAGERAAAELKKLVQEITAAIDTNGDKTLGDDEVSAFLARVQQSIDTSA